MDPRLAELHVATHHRIEHPSGYCDDVARLALDMNNFAGGAPLAILALKLAAVECMPAIVDLNNLPDMGRMTARLSSDEKIGSLPTRRRARRPAQTSTAWWRRPKRMGSIRGRIWRSSSPSSPSPRQRQTSRPCCRGTSSWTPRPSEPQSPELRTSSEQPRRNPSEVAQVCSARDGMLDPVQTYSGESSASRLCDVDVENRCA